MLLALDIRTTTTVLGLFTGPGSRSELVCRWRLHTDPLLTADEFALQLTGVLGEFAPRVTAVVALATVPSVLRELRILLDENWSGIENVLIQPGVRTGVPLLVDNPREIGPDRIANALAAYQRYRSAVLVVDIGVSTVVDVVSAKGEFLGGVIAPGVQLSADALVERAALRRVELQRPRSVVGKNTVEAIQSGAVFGFAALVDGVIERIRTDIDGFSESAAPAVVTGAYAELLVDASRTLTELHPNLTLEGLKLLFDRNRRR